MRSFNDPFEKISWVQSKLPKAQLDPVFLASAIEVAPLLHERWMRWVQREAQPLSEVEIAQSLSELSDTVPFAKTFLDANRSITSRKEDYRADPSRFFNRALADSSLWRKKTSGTTGPPLDVIYDNVFHFEQLYQTVSRVLNRFEARRDRGAHNCVSVAALHDNPRSRNTIWPDPTDGFRCIVQVFVSESSLQQNRDVLSTLRALRPEVITLKPSILDSFARQGYLDELSCSFIISSGSHLSKDVRARAEAATAVPIIEAYGLTETALFASECPMQNGLHIDGDVSVAILKKDGMPVENGPGRLVVTTARNVAMPLMRYETGDIAELSFEKCACGRSTPRIIKLGGRVMDNFRLACGREVSPSNLHHVFEMFSIEEIQFIQKSPDHFVIRLQEREKMDRAELVAFFQGVICAPVKVVIEEATFTNTKADKFQRYIRDF